jgi:cation diffusion facilitator family transporter
MNDAHHCRHRHALFVPNPRGERNSRIVTVLTAVMMIVEIAGGVIYGSMALLADGWHMGTHVAALGITVFAYRYARRHADNPLYSFGTGKIGVLGGFGSAVALAVVSMMMAGESISRFLHPIAIRFDEAIVVAVIGLVVNLFSAYLLQDQHEHDRLHAHAHQHDHNLRAAYLHVLADALTSVLAIVALILGREFGWTWIDPVMGVVGALIILRWSYGLLRDTSAILLDGAVPLETVASIRAIIEEQDDNRVDDLHVWCVSPNQMAGVLSITTSSPKPAAYYQSLLTEIEFLTHLTIEVHPLQTDEVRKAE